MRADTLVETCASPGLIDINSACARAARYCRPISATASVALVDAVGRTLAEDVIASIAQPPFTQSAMDGYALAAGEGLAAGSRLSIVGSASAGHSVDRRVHAFDAVRILTGAPLPDGADCVIMQEHVVRDGVVIVLGKPMRAGDNIRHRGEDIEPLEPLLSRGQKLDARHIALLAAQGHVLVPALLRPRIAVVSTGDELTDPGVALASAAIYDSNRPMLMALARQAELEIQDGGWVRDETSAIAGRLRELAASVDLIITTGGASVGDEDHSARAVKAAGGFAETLKIALKPGKPAIVGRIGEAAYLGLPGNPVSCLVCWLLLGRAMIGALEGRSPRRPRGAPLRSFGRFDRRPGRLEFAPARLTEDEMGIGIEILGRGGSARLRPLAAADGLAEISAASHGVAPGDIVLFHPFGSGFTV